MEWLLTGDIAKYGLGRAQTARLPLICMKASPNSTSAAYRQQFGPFN